MILIGSQVPENQPHGEQFKVTIKYFEIHITDNTLVKNLSSSTREKTLFFGLFQDNQGHNKVNIKHRMLFWLAQVLGYVDSTEE